MPFMSGSMISAEENPSRPARFKRGASLGSPIFLGYMPVGAAFGVLATASGFSVVQAVVCSATNFAGAGQFITLGLMQGGEAAFAVIAAVTVVNLRHVLFAATISPYLRGMPTRNQAFLAFTLTDETFAVNVNDRRMGLATGASMAAVGATAWSGWVLGTLIGSIAADWIGNPQAWGLGFAMPAMFTALFIALAENKRQVIVGVLAGAIIIALPLLGGMGLDIPDVWHIVIAAVVAATAGTVFFDE